MAIVLTVGAAIAAIKVHVPRIAEATLGRGPIVTRADCGSAGTP